MGTVSRLVATIVYSRQVGSMVRKAVLAYCADRASDDGRGIWASKQRIADEIECDRRTVIRTINALIADGILEAVGTRSCRGGATIEYSINITAVLALPATVTSGIQSLVTESHQGQDVTKGSDTESPKPSLNRPVPKKDKPSLVARKKIAPHPLPEDWWPSTFGEGTDCAQIIALWQPGRLEREMSKFRANHTARGTKFRDWQAAWKTWVLNSVDYERAGSGNQQSNGLRGSRPDPSLDLLRQANAEIAAERAAQAGDRGTWPALPALGAG